MRTLVISDAHGFPELIESALEHADFCPGTDALIYAGDLLDRGPASRGCLELVERYATEVLLGNHEVAVLLDSVIYPQHVESRALRPLLIDRVLNAPAESAWKAAACVDGVIVTHAGVSELYGEVFGGQCQGDPRLLGAYLNQELLTAVRLKIATGEWDGGGVLGDDGPLWFRPRPHSRLRPLSSVRQVVGHTPPLAELAGTGFHMIDPCAPSGAGSARRFRYAVIEGGRVRVEAGVIAPVVIDDLVGACR